MPSSLVANVLSEEEIMDQIVVILKANFATKLTEMTTRFTANDTTNYGYVLTLRTPDVNAGYKLGVGESFVGIDILPSVIIRAFGEDNKETAMTKQGQDIMKGYRFAIDVYEEGTDSEQLLRIVMRMKLTMREILEANSDLGYSGVVIGTWIQSSTNSNLVTADDVLFRGVRLEIIVTAY